MPDNQIISFVKGKETLTITHTLKTNYDQTAQLCADPESFDRGGPNLITFFKLMRG